MRVRAARRVEKEGGARSCVDLIKILATALQKDGTSTAQTDLFTLRALASVFSKEDEIVSPLAIQEYEIVPPLAIQRRALGRANLL